MNLIAEDVINRAVQRSALNNPDLIPTAQVLGYITTFEKRAFVTAARRNPEYFGKSGDTESRGDHTEAWDLEAAPGDVAVVTAARVGSITGSVSGVSVGDEINLVSFRWPQLEIAPRAYIRGRKIFGYEDELGEDGSNFVDTLTVYYSELPPAVTTVAQELRIPEEWADLVILPLARLFAVRDSRDPQEVQILDDEFNQNFAIFIEHVGAYDHGANRPLIAVPASGRPPAGGD